MTLCSIISNLSFCTSDSLEVRNLLRALVSRATFDRVTALNAEELIELFVGFRHFNPDHVEVRSVVSALLPSISEFFEMMRDQPDVRASVLRQSSAHAFIVRFFTRRNQGPSISVSACESLAVPKHLFGVYVHKATYTLR